MSIIVKDTTYNGWKNYQTWNVALWIDNDEPLYRQLVAYAKKCDKRRHLPTYTGFVRFAGLDGCKTGDDVSYSDHRLSRKELSVNLFEGLLSD
jgi:hypothetical protein